MLIGIDASRAIVDCPTGTAVYSQQLIQALLTIGGGHRFRLYFRSRPPAHLSSAFVTAEHSVIPFPRLWTHVRLSWEMVRCPPDVLFVPAHVLPLVHPHASVVTIHDLGYLYFPDAHRTRERLYLDWSTRWNARAARHIIADSRATKADLVNWYRVPPEKVTVVYPGVNLTQLMPCPQEQVEATKRKYGIEGSYYLYVGRLEPRKNLKRLIEAYAMRDGQTPHLLVLAGRAGWKGSELRALVERLGLQRRVLFPGYIPEADKAALMSGAIAFVFPSLYEGFGLPVLEAQACACPVVTSSTSSLPEVAGEGALFVQPEDVRAIGAALRQVAEDHLLRRELVERGLENVRRFSWHRCAQQVLHILTTCAG